MKKFGPGKTKTVSEYTNKLVAHHYQYGIPQSYEHKAKNWSSRQIIHVSINK